MRSALKLSVVALKLSMYIVQPYPILLLGTRSYCNLSIVRCFLQKGYDSLKNQASTPRR